MLLKLIFHVALLFTSLAGTQAQRRCHACATFVASLYFGFAVQLVAAFLDDGHAVVVEHFGVGVDADAVVFDAEVDAVVGLFSAIPIRCCRVSGGWRFEWIHE